MFKVQFSLGHPEPTNLPLVDVEHDVHTIPNIGDIVAFPTDPAVEKGFYRVKTVLHIIGKQKNGAAGHGIVVQAELTTLTNVLR
ncbi:hypothetical protein [Herbaspirillum sp. GW103]|uniref:hypothetical protein n=1 Tax=Herbaspirillum sp. GW103 TaxID=1175306 RepID=UPI0012F6F539|nr:hypothetical protein [Herbaspirillum sp. GW103]